MSIMYDTLEKCVSMLRTIKRHHCSVCSESYRTHAHKHSLWALARARASARTRAHSGSMLSARSIRMHDTADSELFGIIFDLNSKTARSIPYLYAHDNTPSAVRFVMMMMLVMLLVSPVAAAFASQSHSIDLYKSTAQRYRFMHNKFCNCLFIPFNRFLWV